jgi:hypothetical protein
MSGGGAPTYRVIEPGAPSGVVVKDADGTAVETLVTSAGAALATHDAELYAVVCDLAREVKFLRLALAEALGSSLKLDEVEI